MRQHSIQQHVLAPIWLRIPERWRWAIVTRLDKSRKQCWCDLVEAALARGQRDACDVVRSCYCGKFQFRAPDGARDRRRAATP